jgi:hypothetical protein
MEHRIDTTFIVGSSNEVPCQAAAFVVPLRIDAEVFNIDAYLLDIGNDVDIILRTPWLLIIALAIDDGTAAPAWSMDQGLIFFDSCLDIPAASSILADILQVLLHAGPRRMELLALGLHLPLSTAHDNGAPTSTHLGHTWP